MDINTITNRAFEITVKRLEERNTLTDDHRSLLKATSRTLVAAAFGQLADIR